MKIPFSDISWNIPSIPVLAALAFYDILGLFQLRLLGIVSLVDHGAHLGGMVTGALGAGCMKWQMGHWATKAEQMKQEQGAVGGNVASWRQTSEREHQREEEEEESDVD